MKTIHIDLSNKNVLPVVYAKQGDVGRKFAVVFTEAGTPYNIPNDAHLSVWYDGDSGDGNYTHIGEDSAFLIDGNTVEVEMITQMLSAPGRGNMCIVLANSEGEQIGSWNITYICEERPGFDSEGAISYFNAFSEVIEAAAKFTVDKTLSKSGSPADAAVTGSRIEAERKLRESEIAVERARINELVAMRTDDGSIQVDLSADAISGYIKTNGFHAYASFTVKNVTLGSAEAWISDYFIPKELCPFTKNGPTYTEWFHAIGKDEIFIEVIQDSQTGMIKLRIYNESEETITGNLYIYGEYALAEPYCNELADIRIGYDGTTYPTAGESVRTQVGSVSRCLDSVLDALPDGMREQTPIEVVYDAELTQGSIDYDGIETENTERIRTNFIPVGNGIVGTLPEGSTRRFAVRVYSELKEYLGYASHDATGFIVSNAWGTGSPVVVDNIVKYYPTAGYVRFYYDTGDIDAVGVVFTYPSVEVGGLNGTTLDEVYGRTPKQPYKDGNISFCYTIDEDGHYTRGWLKLPSNYSPIGKPVPLIVFMPASNTFTSINSTMVTESYEKNYNYLRDCGYAIASFYGWGNVYSAGAGVWGTPTNDKCHIKGIQYVCEHYNVDPENIFVTTKSLGGIQALSLCYQNEVKIKACGLLAPELDMMTAMSSAYSKENRAAIAIDLGFTGDWQSVLYVENDTFNRNEARTYLQTQMDKLASTNPLYRSVLLPFEAKMAASFNGTYDNTAFRLCNVPIKIWGAPDDGSVSYARIVWVIETLKNAGCNGELRTMPEGTGGHQAVDRSENALQTTDVTTRLGVHYDTIPTAYYELEQYFARFAFKPSAITD